MDSDDNGKHIQPGTSGQGTGGGSNACVACRKVKMRCQLLGSARCARCERKSLDCVFKQHRRGKKLGMRAPSAREQSRPRTDREGVSNLEQSLQDSANRAHHTASATRAGFWADRQTSLQPASLLNGQAGGGGFSLENVLQSGVPPVARPRLEPSSPDKQDPITAELLNHAIAASLFAGFMMHLNPFVSQLDPDLHTMEWVRAKSSFLFTTTLMAAAKSLNPALYSSLRDHAEVLLLDAFRCGTKSAEVVQAILIMTYWKDPDDTRAFVNVGLAIRIAIDLGWHDLESCSRFSSQHTETYTRELRNAERTWLVLFVYDRSLAMQTGKPFMIENGPLIDSIEDWQDSFMSCRNDLLLCAFVKLRLLTSSITPNVVRTGEATSGRQLMARSLRASVSQWSARWSDNVATDERHRFLINLYGCHALLLLCSDALHQTLSSQPHKQDMPLETIWAAYDAATSILALVAEQPSAAFLYFAQDSVHVMIAYAAVLLVKLLLSVPSSVHAELKSASVSALHTLLAALNAQAAPPNSACALQGVFIANLVQMLHSPPPSDLEVLDTAPRTSAQQLRTEHEATSSNTVDSQIVQEDNSREGLGPSTFHSGLYGGLDGSCTSDSGLFDNEVWANVFATAGFDITDGLFLLDPSKG